MTRANTQGAEAEFLDAARRALRTPGTGDPLATLGWWDVLDHLDDLEGRQAALTLFRAHGAELAHTVALGALMAQPYLAMVGLSPGKLVAATIRRSPSEGERILVMGDVGGRSLLIDRPDRGVLVVPADEVALRDVVVPGRLGLREVEWEPEKWGAPVITEDAAAPARSRALVLGRIAASLEILGAAEGAMALAVEHAAVREQFGKPIGSFQAVRHLLAWARTDLAAVDGATALAVRFDGDTSQRYDEIVKALAGRNGRRICERTLQVLGAIGFTEEHEHHHFHSRVLALDSILGSSSELTNELGRWLWETRTDPALAASVLLPGLGA